MDSTQHEHPEMADVDTVNDEYGETSGPPSEFWRARTIDEIAAQQGIAVPQPLVLPQTCGRTTEIATASSGESTTVGSRKEVAARGSGEYARARHQHRFVSDEGASAGKCLPTSPRGTLPDHLLHDRRRIVRGRVPCRMGTKKTVEAEGNDRDLHRDPVQHRSLPGMGSHSLRTSHTDDCGRRRMDRGNGQNLRLAAGHAQSTGLQQHRGTECPPGVLGVSAFVRPSSPCTGARRLRFWRDHRGHEIDLVEKAEFVQMDDRTRIAHDRRQRRFSRPHEVPNGRPLS